MNEMTIFSRLRLAQQSHQCVEVCTRSRQHFGPGEVLDLDPIGAWVRLSSPHLFDDPGYSQRIPVADITGFVVHNDE